MGNYKRHSNYRNALRGIAAAANAGYQLLKPSIEAAINSRFRQGKTLTETQTMRRIRRFNNGVDPGVFRGPLTRRLHRASKGKSAVKRGALSEFQYAGEFNMNDCHYIGCASYSEVDAFNSIGVAILRVWFSKHALSRQSFQCEDDTIFGNAEENNRVFIQFVNQDGTADVVDSLDWATTPATTLKAAAAELVNKFLTRWYQGYLPWRMFTDMQYKDSNGNNARSFPGMMDLSRLKVHFTRKTWMNVQATTKGDDGSSLITDITQNPLVGKLMYFKDKFPVCDPQRLSAAGADWGPQYLENFRLKSPFITPGIVGPLTGAIGAGSGSPTGAWKSVPLASMFKNCVKEGPVSMDPSFIKRAMIRFSFHGTIENWLSQYTRFDAANVTAPSESVDENTFGTSMLLAIEKRVRTGSSIVRINAHFDAVQRAWVSFIPAAPMQKATIINTAVEPGV